MVGKREIIFGFFLTVRGMILRRGTALRSGSFPLPGRLSRVERHENGSRVGGFGGLVVEVIVGKGVVDGARRISTEELSTNTN